MAIKRFKPTDPIPGAERRNEMVDHVNRAQLDDGPRDRKRPRLMMFELTEVMTYPADPAEPPYSDGAKPVVYIGSTDEYTAQDEWRPEKIYHPMAVKDQNGQYVDLKQYAVGDVFLCFENRQSGRWEIVSRQIHEEVDFVLTQDITTTTVAGTLIDHDGNSTGVAIILTDVRGMFTGGTDGSNGIAEAVRGEFRIKTLECPSGGDVTGDALIGSLIGV